MKVFVEASKTSQVSSFKLPGLLRPVALVIGARS